MNIFIFLGLTIFINFIITIILVRISNGLICGEIKTGMNGLEKQINAGVKNNKGYIKAIRNDVLIKTNASQQKATSKLIKAILLTAKEVDRVELETNKTLYSKRGSVYSALKQISSILKNNREEFDAQDELNNQLAEIIGGISDEMDDVVTDIETLEDDIDEVEEKVDELYTATSFEFKPFNVVVKAKTNKAIAIKVKRIKK